MLAEDHAVCFNCLSVINVGKSGFVKFGAGFARPFLGCIFPIFCGVIWFYDIKLEAEVDFCMFLLVYMFSKQISCWNRIGMQTASGRFKTGRQTGRQLQPGTRDNVKLPTGNIIPRHAGQRVQRSH